MRLVVNLKHVLHGKLSVALGRRKPLVAKHFLNGAQVGALLKHVRAESVTQSVRMHVRRQSFRYRDLLDDAPRCAS